MKLGEIPQRIYNRYLLARYVKPFAKKNQNRIQSENNTISLFCQPRGGSTWLTQLLMEIPSTSIVDEPLWRGRFSPIDKMPEQKNRKIKAVADMEFYHVQPILENESWPEAEQMIQNTISGRAPVLGVYNQFKLSRLLNFETLIVKYNLAQLLLHWYVKHFQSKNILLIRHPCGLVNSQKDFPGFININQFKNRKFPHFRNHEIFNQYESVFSKFTTLIEWQAFFWAVQIRHSLYHPDNNRKWLTVSYEKLVVDFPNEIARIFKYLQREIPDSIHSLQFKPSLSTVEKSIKSIESGTQLDRWKKELTKDQISRILNVANAMEIDIYSDAPEPDYEKMHKAHPRP